MKVGVDQSAVSVSRCNKVGTLLCRFLTRIYPVVSFTPINNLFYGDEFHSRGTHILKRKLVTLSPLPKVV